MFCDPETGKYPRSTQGCRNYLQGLGQDYILDLYDFVIFKQKNEKPAEVQQRLFLGYFTIGAPST